MNSNELRKKYLDFFQARGHVCIPSAVLVPDNDPTTLFTGSGMQPLVPYLLGQAHPAGQRLVNSQKSFRAEDIEEVGDNRHDTFFEMLGNWSLGDYFKAEQLAWFFEFLTKELGIDPQKLYVTVFAGDPKNNLPEDAESVQIWKDLFAGVGIIANDIVLGRPDEAGDKGMQNGRIFYYEASKNWWSRSGSPEKMPAGEPGGPNSEVFYDFGTPHDQKYGAMCHPNCDCGRFVELGNSVFMVYKKMSDQAFQKLDQQNVDFGGGLERICAAVGNDPDIFHLDLFKPAFDIFATRVPEYEDHLRSKRIMADHLRAATMLVTDGVLPSNKGRGYILRRVLRRALVHGRLIGVNDLDLVHKIVDGYIAMFSEIYPEVLRNRDNTLSVISIENNKFNKTLDKGLKILQTKTEITGHEAFDLFQTHGFPFELTREFVQISAEQEFHDDLKQHQQLSRTSSAGVFRGGLADHSERTTRLHTATHLLQAGLRQVLGKQLFQKGSHVTSERTRFDFNHPEKVSDEDLKKVEVWVNIQIQRDLPMIQEFMTANQAHALGAIGLFDEKYEEQVSVYTISDPEGGEVVSREFCGGPHVQHTSQVGKFKILKEEAVAGGIRRIKATVE